MIPRGNAVSLLPGDALVRPPAGAGRFHDGRRRLPGRAEGARQPEREAIAQITAPFAKIQFGRDASFIGCFCVDQSKSDKHITLTCPTP